MDDDELLYYWTAAASAAPAVFRPETPDVSRCDCSGHIDERIDELKAVLEERKELWLKVQLPSALGKFFR